MAQGVKNWNLNWSLGLFRIAQSRLHVRPGESVEREREIERERRRERGKSERERERKKREKRERERERERERDVRLCGGKK